MGTEPDSEPKIWRRTGAGVLSPVYTWRTLTGVKLNNNRTQYFRPAIFLAV